MALNIKNARTESLAHQVARETGETLTQAVTRALEERLERLNGRRQAPDLRDTLLEISRRCRALPDLDQRPTHEILGYDELGGFSDGD
ncbi:type II toxin-antitoxin system VapB family antitoxin [bacterium]|nr:type II toxin-antitoxin system VapB family antitoxin [bacterium]